MSLLAAYAVLALVAAPGALAFTAFAGWPRRLEEGIEALAVGFGAAFPLLWLCGTLDLRLFSGAWAALLVLAGLALRRSGRERPASVAPSPETRFLAAMLLVWLALRTAPLLVHPFPVGWDPYFHLILAEKVARAGRLVEDWEPFEQIRLNYPLGLHLLLAWTARISGAALTTTFNAAMVSATLGVALGTFAVASRATAAPRVAAFGAAAAAFWSLEAGLNPTLEGSLQSAVPMALILAAVALLMREDLSYRVAGTSVGLLAGAILHVHHHAALGAALVLGTMGLRGLVCRDPMLLRRVALAFAVSGLVGLPVIARYLDRLPFASLTGLDSHPEAVPAPAGLVDLLGAPFFYATLLGAAAAWWKRRQLRLDRALLAVAGSLIAAMLVLHFGVRALAFVWKDPAMAPLAPLRFLRYAVPFLAVFPGLLLHAAVRSTRGAAAVILAGALALHQPYARLFLDPVPARDRLEAYAWVQAHTPPESMLLDGWVHAPYLAWRTTPVNPLPVSEFWKLARNRNRGHAIAFGGASPSLAGRPVVWIRDPEVPPAGQVLWRHASGLEVALLWPRPGAPAAPPPAR